jgi:FHA domain-containing protein
MTRNDPLARRHEARASVWTSVWQQVCALCPAVPRAARLWQQAAFARPNPAKARAGIMFDSAQSLASGATDRGPWIDTAVNTPTSAARFLLWVDAVGGFFVCLGNETRLGQAVPGSTVELPLVADLSRHHATIRRDEEGYTIEPLRDVRLNHHKIDAVSWLTDGNLIEVGPALQLRFRRPHPLSATARLDFVTNHRTQPSAASVLLMADTCVLGPGENSHVVCRAWPHDVVLHRQQGRLFCRSASPVEIDGHRYAEGGPLTLRSRVIGEDFSFSLEEI